MCRASRAQACSVCTPLLEAIEWPSVRTMRASTRASQHARRCASPRAVCAGVARAFTSLLHGRVSCHVVLVRYSFSRYSFSASKCMRAIRKVSQSRCVRIGVYSQTCATHHASRLMCCETTSYMYSELELYTPQPPIDCVCVSDLYPRLRLHR